MTIPKALASAATGEGVGMIGGTSGSELIHGRFQRVHGGDQLCVCRGGAGEADDADPAAGTDLPVLSAVRGFIDDVDKCFGAGFEAGERRPCHTAGAVQNQDDVRWIGSDIRSGCKGNA